MSGETERANLEVLWTPTQLAKYLGVSMVTVYRWLKAGRVKSIHLGTRSIRIPRSEVERISAQQKAKIIGEGMPS